MWMRIQRGSRHNVFSLLPESHDRPFLDRLKWLFKMFVPKLKVQYFTDFH